MRDQRDGTRLVLQIMAVVMFGLTWLLISEMAKKYGPASGDTTGGSPAAAPEFSNFQLWEFHADDSLRFVDVVVQPGAGPKATTLSLPLRRAGDDVTSLEFIGAKLAGKQDVQEEYNGVTYQQLNLDLQTNADQYGFIARIAHPPHLHINDRDRLISIGFDPTPGWKQLVVVVAVPASAQVSQVYDYEPYKTAEMNGWKLYYYDVLGIQSHVSIHILFTPDADASPLDWGSVMENR
jgi:hypothetical protein